MAKKHGNDERAEGATTKEEEARPGEVIPPKVAPKLKAEPSLLPPDIVEQAAIGYVEKFRENWQVIAAASLVVIVVAVFLNWRIDASRKRNQLAQEELRKALVDGGEAGPPREKLEELATTYAGTSGQPFILLALGDLDARKGDLDKAAATYERVARDFASNPVAADIARRSLERTRKAQAFDPLKRAAEKGEKTEWAKGETPGSSAAPAPAPAAPAATAPAAPAPAPAAPAAPSEPATPPAPK